MEKYYPTLLGLAITGIVVYVLVKKYQPIVNEINTVNSNLQSYQNFWNDVFHPINTVEDFLHKTFGHSANNGNGTSGTPSMS